MLLQKEKKKRRNKLSIRNVLKKEIIYERRNRSLSFRTNLFFFPPKKRCELSVKASFASLAGVGPVWQLRLHLYYRCFLWEY